MISYSDLPFLFFDSLLKRYRLRLLFQFLRLRNTSDHILGKPVHLYNSSGVRLRSGSSCTIPSCEESTPGKHVKLPGYDRLFEQVYQTFCFIRDIL